MSVGIWAGVCREWFYEDVFKRTHDRDSSEGGGRWRWKEGGGECGEREVTNPARCEAPADVWKENTRTKLVYLRCSSAGRKDREEGLKISINSHGRGIVAISFLKFRTYCNKKTDLLPFHPLPPSPLPPLLPPPPKNASPNLPPKRPPRSLLSPQRSQLSSRFGFFCWETERQERGGRGEGGRAGGGRVGRKERGS